MPDNISPLIAGNVRAEMARAGVSGRSLAAKLGVTYQTLARRISGEMAFDVDRLAQVAAALDVPLERLYAVEPTAAAS